LTLSELWGRDTWERNDVSLANRHPVPAGLREARHYKDNDDLLEYEVPASDTALQKEQAAETQGIDRLNCGRRFYDYVAE
jgi:hypothetical protein